MKVQCDVCERAEATVLCCADEAALCRSCDEQVHAANKLAGKHQRIPLLRRSPSNAPSCDICQEKAGYFFCLEDRALLCRDCDVGVHTASAYVSSHQRFLITGVRAAVEDVQAEANSSSSSGGEGNRVSSNPSSASMASEASPSKKPRAGDVAAVEEMVFGYEQEMGFRSQWGWGWSEMFGGGGGEFGEGYGASEFGSSPVDSR